MSPSKGFTVAYSFSKSFWGTCFQRNRTINKLKFISCKIESKELKNCFIGLTSQILFLKVLIDFFRVFDFLKS
jgi:hypothetical protein